jgi:hypothetical protein
VVVTASIVVVDPEPLSEQAMNSTKKRGRERFIRMADDMAAGSAGRGSGHRLLVERGEISNGRPMDHPAFDIETRSMTRAIPGALRSVELHLAAAVSADGRDGVNRAAIVAESSGLVPIDRYDVS